MSAVTINPEDFSYKYTMFMSRHSTKLAIVYLVAMGIFIGIMAKNFPLETKAIVGYSYLGAHVIMALMLIPYIQTRKKLDAINVSRPSRQIFNFVTLLQVYPNLATIPSMKISPIRGDLLFRPEEISHPIITGEFDSVFASKISFYAIKVRARNNPNDVRVYTFAPASQSDTNVWNIYSNSSLNPVFHNEAATNSQILYTQAFQEKLQALFQNTHPTYELVPSS